MKLFGRVNALEVTKADGELDILLTVIYATVNDSELDICFRRGTEYVHKTYEAGAWIKVEEV